MQRRTCSFPVTIEKGLALSSLFGHEEIYAHLTYQGLELKLKVTGFCIYPDKVEISAEEYIEPRLIINAYSQEELVDQLLVADQNNEARFSIERNEAYPLGIFVVEIGKFEYEYELQ